MSTPEMTGSASITIGLRVTADKPAFRLSLLPKGHGMAQRALVYEAESIDDVQTKLDGWLAQMWDTRQASLQAQRDKLIEQLATTQDAIV